MAKALTTGVIVVFAPTVVFVPPLRFFKATALVGSATRTANVIPLAQKAGWKRKDNRAAS